MSRLRWTKRQRAISTFLKAEGFEATLFRLDTITNEAANEQDWRPSERAMSLGSNRQDCRIVAQRIGVPVPEDLS